MPNIGATKYIKQILTDIKREIDNDTIILGEFNISLTSMDRSSRHKVNKEIIVLNDTLDQLDLIDTYRIFHPKTAEYTFFSSVQRMFSRVDHMVGYKTSLRTFKRIEMISSIFPTTVV